MPKGFGERTYQQWIHTQDLQSFRVVVEETELLILAQADLSEQATRAVLRYRAEIEAYIARHPEFRTSLQPIEADEHAPSIIRDMAAASQKSGVGPFAAVAGAMSEYVGNALLPYSSEIIIENGGDIFIAGTQDRTLGIYAGDSPLSGTIALKIAATQLPCGVCTSSGTIGHSLSFGKADAAIVNAHSTPLADACATALGNTLSAASDIPAGLAFAEQIEGVDGAVAIVGDQIGAWGQIQLVKMNYRDRVSTRIECSKD